MKRVWIVVALALAVALAVPVPVRAGGAFDGRVILGDNFTLASGEVLDGDLVVVGGNVTLEQGSVVHGDVFVLGGNIQADGEIDGDVALVGGNVELGGTAIVRGALTTLGGSLERSPDAIVEGELIAGEGLNFPFREDWARGLVIPLQVWPLRVSPMAESLWFLFRALMMAALAALLVLVWPDGSRRVAEAVSGQPILAGGLGLLTPIVAVPLLILLSITIILIPATLIVGFLLAVAYLLGWSAVGLEVGRRLSKALSWDLHPAAAAGMGTFLLGVLAGALGFVACVGWVVSAFVGSLGLGGVLITRFGTRSYALAPAPAGGATPPLGGSSPPAPELPPDPSPPQP